MVDGNDIDKKLEWFNTIGYIPQNIFLFNRSLKNNITFTDDEIDLKKLNNALEMSLVKEFIDVNQNNLDIKINEFGNNLSGGQKQRIGIARALYKDPEVLILDEATNALDQNTEKSVLENIYSLKDEKTLIIISHNNSILKNCDRIFEIKDKNLKEIIE